MPKLIITQDGSHSLFHEALNETYHSVHGAIQESVYVFIRQGLAYLLQHHPESTVAILEVGFGTGLNALLTLQYSIEQKAPIHYVTIEAYPLEESVWRSLNYPSTIGLKHHFEALHTLSWDKVHEVIPGFQLKKMAEILQEAKFDNEAFDVIFFDAFAPSKQPEMWTIPTLERVASALRPGGIFVTYCARGQLKRDLMTLGFTVETLSGPPGKKEMVRAIKSGF
ncbi:MAG TPA: tRNA (5-methylaminomethyl-2-thiouridine)(34)-methyltransferase MnmD [Ohtaekwangia sp.]|nr:tRNA (5-methylaminomethyl-2-thiouridine)(34)-methyltransferase MnmD [Ohtaekwangia sp.]